MSDDPHREPTPAEYAECRRALDELAPGFPRPGATEGHHCAYCHSHEPCGCAVLHLPQRPDPPDPPGRENWGHAGPQQNPKPLDEWNQGWRDASETASAEKWRNAGASVLADEVLRALVRDGLVDRADHEQIRSVVLRVLGGVV